MSTTAETLSSGTAGSRRCQRAASKAARLQQQYPRLTDLPRELITRIAEALPADGKKALRATCRLLRDAAGSAVTHIALTSQFDHDLRAAQRRRAACLRMGAVLPAVASITIHPPLARPGTLVHKILRQLPRVASITFLADKASRQPPTLRPLGLCPALPSTLRTLVINTLHSSLAPLSLLTSLTAVELAVPCRHPPTLLAPLSRLTNLLNVELNVEQALDPFPPDCHPALLHPLASLPSLRSFGILHAHAPSPLHPSDHGHSLALFTQLTSLTALCNSMVTINSILSLTNLRCLAADPVTRSARFWQTPPRPTFPHLTTLMAPLCLLQAPATPHAPALLQFAATCTFGSRALDDAPHVTMFSATLANVPLTTIATLHLGLPSPRQTPAFLHLLAGSAAPRLTGLALCFDERHLADLAPLMGCLPQLPPTLLQLELVCNCRSTAPPTDTDAKLAALQSRHLYGHLRGLVRVRASLRG